jgi:peptide-methionine (S)-S-oxide reductase
MSRGAVQPRTAYRREPAAAQQGDFTMISRRISLLAAALVVAAIGSHVQAQPGSAQPGPAQPAQATATFAGGCFWCMEAPFDKLDGVASVTVGYTAGKKENPTYQEVSAGITGHTEAVQIVYDPAKVSYQKLLDIFWRNIDPLTPNAQFCDHGSQYRSGIYYHDDDQKQLAEASKAALEKSGRFDKPIVTEIVAASKFWPAEDYHQHYYVKSPLRYKVYRLGCGRDRRLEQLWGKDQPS